jgi:hypothetical protein
MSNLSNPKELLALQLAAKKAALEASNKEAAKLHLLRIQLLIARRTK